MCIPTRMFSIAVMFWNRRMFWKVRPRPASTMSLGRALRKIPIRPSSRVYQAGRATAEISIVVNAASVRARPATPVVSEFVARNPPRVRTATMIAGVTQTKGSR